MTIEAGGNRTAANSVGGPSIPDGIMRRNTPSAIPTYRAGSQVIPSQKVKRNPGQYAHEVKWCDLELFSLSGLLVPDTITGSVVYERSQIAEPSPQ